jgi:hypothetical protein
MKPLIEPKEGPDSRLKVLWIEDKQPAKLSQRTLTLLSRCFAIWRAWAPHEVASSLKDSLQVINSKYAEAESYTFPALPMDGYLADFDLSGGGEGGNGESSDTDYVMPDPDEGVDVTLAPGEGSGDVSLSELALKAEAAGLTSAVLTALNFFSHPTVIVPYTGHPKQLSFQRALIRLLAPTSLVISQGSELDRGKISLEAKLQDFAQEYRHNLPIWARQVVSIPTIEKNRLRELVISRAYGPPNRQQVRWDDGDAIAVDTLYGRRQISCVSLWFRVDGVDPSLTEVNKWLDEIPTPSSVYSAAVRLANEYWKLSETNASRYRYTLSRLIRLRPSIVSSKESQRIDSTIQALCALCGLDYDVVMESPNDVKMRHGQFVPQLLVSEAAGEVKRLAVFMLLTMEYAARWRSVQTPTDALWRLSRIIEYDASMLPESALIPFKEIDIEKLGRIDMDRLDTMEDIGFEGVRIEGGSYIVKRSPVQDHDMAQRLDPLPEQLFTAEHDFSAGRVGRKLGRIDIDINALIADEKRVMTVEEIKDVQYFALDIGYPRKDWPEWLRKNVL